jgi:hypothetical protein
VVKRCKHCGEEKTLDDFYADRKAKDGRRPECKACNLAARAAKYAAHLKRKFGITLADYDRLLDGQGGVCAICGESRPEERTLHVDHDHVSGAIRGLLCFRCNNSLGDLREDVELFRRATDYLDRDDELDGLVRARVGALAG